MSSQDQAADRLSIERLLASLEEAWARGDATAYASRFADDGTFTNFLGMYFRGRDAFRVRHDAVFRTVFKASTLKLQIEALRFIRPDVAIVDVDAALRGLTALPGSLTAMPDGAVHTRLLMVLAKEQGDWGISAYHNVPIASQLAKG